ncbi:MAG: rhamnulokinase, partial [Clostridiales bacterium]|nr:rhamnulokinase [Clostridiales bacterium]
VVDVDDASFLAPDSMIQAVKDYCAKTNQPVPETVGEVMQCVYVSLTRRYAEAIDDLQKLTGKTYTSINVVGGGCQDGYLNQMTANATGRPVYAGTIDGTAICNLLGQMIRAGEFADLQSARDSVRDSFDIQKVQPITPI